MAFTDAQRTCYVYFHTIITYQPSRRAATTGTALDATLLLRTCIAETVPNYVPPSTAAAVALFYDIMSLLYYYYNSVFRF